MLVQLVKYSWSLFFLWVKYSWSLWQMSENYKINPRPVYHRENKLNSLRVSLYARNTIRHTSFSGHYISNMTKFTFSGFEKS